MEITKDTKVKDIISAYPWLIDEAIKISDKLKILKTPVGKMMMAKATIEDASKKSGIEVDEIVKKIKEMIEEHK